MRSKHLKKQPSNLERNFYKMQSLGNDFMVLYQDSDAINPQPHQIRAWADRRRGIGFDQLLVLSPQQDPQEGDFLYRIFNADGSEAEQCGNGARCMGHFIHHHGLSQKHMIGLKTRTRLISVWKASVSEPVGGNVYSVNMGEPCLGIGNCFDIPLRYRGKTLMGFNVDLGNPHLVILDHQSPILDPSDLAAWAFDLTQDPRFPNGTNVSVVQQWQPKTQTVEMRIIERGVGETPACGSAAAAVFVIMKHLGCVEGYQRPMTLAMPGGQLSAQSLHGSVVVTGPSNFVYQGQHV